MDTQKDMRLFLDTMVKQGLSSSPKRLHYKMSRLFSTIDFNDKRVLDIGGGSGLYSFYAACQGAGQVVCIEPEADGSTVGVTERFHTLRTLLNLENIVHRPVTLQDFETQGETFDVIILYDSINHLNEDACIRLLEDRPSWTIYKDLCAKIFALASPGAAIMVCDCSRHNFFGKLKIRNPFVPTIEWHKHQTPRVWIKLLTEAGFRQPRVKWLSLNTLGSLGDKLLGNPLMAYFMTSHFQLLMKAS
ncbi:MAG: methyltransferase domain-containing protein [Desulfatibacillum sp.]|nr:methyltransferase domain-containing protein [Desulfatibacillum sp.]